MDLRQELVKILVKETKLSTSEIENLLSVPPDPKLGDYAFPCFKCGGKAEETIVGIIKQGKKYGSGQSSQNIVLEYCGPNTNKPLHLGHIRNMALGKAVCNLLTFQKNKVHPVNIVNDRGIHICQSMLAYQKWGKKSNQGKPTKKGDHFVGDYYVKFAQEVKDNPALKDEAQAMLNAWENNDKDVRKLWKLMNSWVLKGFAQTYKRFGVSFDKEYFESEYYEKGKEIVQEGMENGVFEKEIHPKEKNDGLAIIAPLEKYGLPNKVILRGDGTSIYITQDMYLAGKRYADFKFDKMMYVVASEQQLHFKQLFKILELLQRPFAQNLFHLSYGLVNLPTGRMKSRARYKDLSEKEIKKRSEAIGLAAIKFFMLRTDATKDIVFNPEESLSFEGETGPYLQYTHARACSILRKAGKIKGKANFDLLKEPQEQALTLLLSKFPDRIKEATDAYRVHILCRYLLDLAQAFNEFYHAQPVISDDKELMKARTMLVGAVQQVLQTGLELLNIEAMEEM
ncbi:arginine--tRNA ligase [Candidatus Woesearchaeota archaeon]|nr:arginine--tRNA ligase [Candidatus Woesearchaeota archaeon]